MHTRTQKLLIGLTCLGILSFGYHGYWLVQEYQTSQVQLQKAWTRFAQEYTFQLNKHITDITPFLRSIKAQAYIFNLHFKNKSSEQKIQQSLWLLYQQLHYLKIKYNLPSITFYTQKKTLLFILTSEYDYLYFPKQQKNTVFIINESSYYNMFSMEQIPLSVIDIPLQQSFIPWESHYIQDNFHIWQHHIKNKGNTLGFLLFHFPFPQYLFEFITQTYSVSIQNHVTINDVPMSPIATLQQVSPKIGHHILSSSLTVQVPGKVFHFSYSQKYIIFRCIEILVYYTILSILGAMLFLSQKQHAIQQEHIVEFLLDIIPNLLIFIKAKNGTFLYTNKAFQEFFNDVNRYNMLRNEDVHVLQGEREIDIKEYIREHIFLSSKYPLYDDNGKVYAIAFIKKDVTKIAIEYEKYILATQMIVDSLTSNV